MSVVDYADCFVSNLFVGGLVTFWVMSLVNYLDWLGDGITGMPPGFARLFLVALLVSVILFFLPWLWLVLRKPWHILLADSQHRAGVWRGRAIGVVFGLGAGYFLGA